MDIGERKEESVVRIVYGSWTGWEVAEVILYVCSWRVVGMQCEGSGDIESGYANV